MIRGLRDKRSVVGHDTVLDRKIRFCYRVKNRRHEATNASGARLAAHMAHDKKRDGGNVPFLLARGIGQTYLERDVALADVAAFLDSDR